MLGLSRPSTFALQVCVSCALWLTSWRASAQAAPQQQLRSMSLREALAYARAHQPDIAVARARWLAEQAASGVPRSQWLPVVGASAQLFAATANNTTGTYISPDSFDIPRIGATRGTDTGSLRPYASTLAAVGARQELFDFGRIAAQSAVFDAQAHAARARLRATELDVTFDVEEAYFAVLAAKAVVTASAGALERSRTHRDRAKAGVDAGMRSPIELTRAEADLSHFDIGRSRAEGGLALAQTSFAASVGLDDGPLDAQDAAQSAPDLPLLADAIAHAAARDPALQAALAQLMASEQRVRAIGTELRPDLHLTGTVSARAGGAPPSGNGSPARADGVAPNVPNWDLGVVLSWPLFDGSVAARLDAGRADAQVARAELQALRHSEIAQIRSAYGSVTTAQLVLPGLQRAVDAAHANYAQAEARFHNGLGTSVELADAEAIRVDAEIQLALGQFDLLRARAAFGRVTAETL